MSDRDRRRAWIAGFVVVSVIAAATLGWLVGRATRSSSAAGAVTLVPADQVGDNPFTESVATDQVPDVGTVSGGASFTTDAQTRTLVAVGTAPGLYGGSGNTRVCDAQKLVSFLAQHRDKATAWARVFGISPDDIASYVASLTPVVLIGDTLVTNHGYHDGAATSFQSVLQAGTAVFVDRTGVPRVKCNCGNPLAPPAAINLSSATFQGTRWGGYAPTQVRIVRAGPSQSTLTLVNVTTGARYDEAVGTGAAGGGAGQWVALVLASGTGVPSQTTIYTSATGASWVQAGTIPNEMIRALVWVDDEWVALARRNEEDSTRVLTSTDLRTWKQIGHAPDSLGAIAHGDGRFVATGAHWTRALLEGGTPHSSPVAYTSTDGKQWSKVGAKAFTESSAGNGWSPPLAAGDGQWLSLGFDEFGPAGGFNGNGLESDDGVHWSENGGHPALSGNAGLAFGVGTWALGGYQPGGLATSTDAKTWTAASVSGVSDPDVETLAFGNGTFLAVDLTVGSTTILSSADGRSWAPIGTGPMGIDVLAFGGRGTGTSPPAETSGNPRCTREALQDVFSHEIDDDMLVAITSSKDELVCADGWAGIHYGNQGRYLLALFHVVNGAWVTQPLNNAGNLGEGEREKAGEYCNRSDFPAELKTAFCG